jgi:O-acetyl-ADP-ribose deacetylase (regulator of RNase III)
VRIVSDREAVRLLLQQRERYVLYLGAGASAEAQVKVADQICTEIRDRMRQFDLTGNEDDGEVEAWANAKLAWDQPSRRYSTCMQVAYPTQAMRVEYFRQLLKGKAPSFCHHAAALLMSSGYVRRTSLTTNFDKLLENAFVQQGRSECQPIRTDRELQYWQDEPERFYVFKLHGDYDTGNVLNTKDETITISEVMRGNVKRLLQDSGMLVIGTTGWEKSIHTTFDYLTVAEAEAERVLSFGLLWGVYMGTDRPEGPIAADDLKKLVQQRVNEGGVAPDIVDMMERRSRTNALFSFFPLWGAGRFMLDAVTETRDRETKATAELYLDHEMRLRQVLARAQLPADTISKHIVSLRRQRQKLDALPPAHSSASETVLVLHRADRKVTIRVDYADITSPTLMKEVASGGVRGAVVSPEDTLISAGGGVAYGLLREAGRYTVLNELAKLSPIGHTRVAVTSGGNLPVQYILHAACLRIEKDGTYVVSQESVRRTMQTVIRMATALDLDIVWVPLMGAGLGKVDPKQSLEGILQAVAAMGGRARPLTIVVVVYREKELTRTEARRILRRSLTDFTFETAAAASR